MLNAIVGHAGGGVAPNKRTKEAADLLASLGCDSLEGMARIALSESNPLGLRARMFAELAPYIYGKRKALEHTGDDGRVVIVLSKEDQAL